MKRLAHFFPMILLLLSGCIGTDLVDEPLGPVPARLSLSYSVLVLQEGETLALSANLVAADGTRPDEPLIWTSRNPSVATVTDYGDQAAIAALAMGQTWIVVSSPTLADSLLLTVSTDRDALGTIEIRSSKTELAIGETLQLNAELRNHREDFLTGRALTWTSSDPAIGTVNSDGLFTALANGTTRITASAEGITSPPFALMVGADEQSRTGTFSGLSGYNVQGTVTLERTANRSELVFGTDFGSQNGPGLYIYLSPNRTNVTGGVNLGKLKATSGSQLYEIPGNVDPDDFDFVLVYCQPFGVPFGVANLE